MPGFPVRIIFCIDNIPEKIFEPVMETGAKPGAEATILYME